MFLFRICVISSFILIRSDVVVSRLEGKVLSAEKDALSRKLMNDPTVCGPDVPDDQPCIGAHPTTVNNADAGGNKMNGHLSKNADENLLNLLGVNQHSLSINVDEIHSLHCGISSGFERFTAQNKWLRRFDLFLDEDIMCPYKISSLIFGVQNVRLGELDFIPVIINLYELSKVDDFVYANLQNIGSRVVTFGSEVTTTFFRVPLIGRLMNPKKFDLVVEIAVENIVDTSSTFFIGQFFEDQNLNDGPTWLASDDCLIPEPVNTTALGFRNDSAVFYVEGEEDENFKHLCETGTDKKRGYTVAHPISKVP